MIQQKRSKEAGVSFHAVVPDVRHPNRDGVVRLQQKHSAVILGVVLRTGRHRASHTFHDLFIVNVGVVSHYWQTSIVVVHLAVYEVVTGCRDSDKTAVVLYGSQLMVDNPVSYDMINCNVK